MATQYRQQSRVDDARYEDLSINDLEHISDDDIAQFLSETEKVEKKESIWNLPTIAGISTIAVGLLYFLQQMGVYMTPFSIVSLVNTFSVMAGLLIVLFGFGILSWKPKAPKPNKTIGKQGNVFSSGSGTAVASGKKTLQKSQTNKKIFGVAGGIAEYFNLDPTLVRIAFVASMFIMSGFTVPIYFILGAVLPKGDKPSNNFPPTNVQNQNPARDRDRIRITRD
jgi:phage shock protein C